MAEDGVRFGTLNADGSLVYERTIPHAAIGACPHFILAPEHYREDDTCRCDDPDHTEMQGWGYAWDGTRWV